MEICLNMWNKKGFKQIVIAIVVGDPWSISLYTWTLHTTLSKCAFIMVVKSASHAAAWCIISLTRVLCSGVSWVPPSFCIPTPPMAAVQWQIQIKEVSFNRHNIHVDSISLLLIHVYIYTCSSPQFAHLPLPHIHVFYISNINCVYQIIHALQQEADGL